MEKTLEKWHQFIASQDPAILGEILDSEVVFHSPFVWKPKHGSFVTTQILLAATRVFSEFTYVREVIQGNEAVLEFAAKVGELELCGVDMIRINSEGKIVDFQVMIRPANALQALGEAMSKQLGL